MKKQNENINQLKQLDIKNQQIKYPSMNPKYLSPKNYTDKTANGLTQCVKDFLNYSGHFAERINTMGRVVGIEPEQRDLMGKIQTKATPKYIKGTGTKGSADISSTIKVNIQGHQVGLSVKWEIKVGKDRQSEDQKIYEAKTQASGGYYYIIRSFDEFINKYNDLLLKFS